MKILVVCQYYKPEPFRISDICEELVSRGHEVTVITGVPNYPMGYIYAGYRNGEKRHEILNGVDVKRCFTIGRRHGAIWRFLNYYSFAFSSKHATGSLDSDYDIVFVNQLSPVMMAEAGIKYAKKHRVPLLMYCLDLWPESLCTGGIAKGSFVYNVFHRISERIYRDCDRILMTSRGFERYLSEEFNIDNSRLAYLPQYAEGLFSATDKANSGMRGKDDAINLVFAGNVGAAQRVDLIVRAAGITEKAGVPVHWHIVGDGSELGACKALADELGLVTVTFHGRHPVEEMPMFYAKADAMLLTLDDDEVISYTLPGKIQSYMAAGKPVIASANGETLRVIRESGCGMCAEAGSAELLAEAVKNFVALSGDARMLMGRKSFEYYNEHFSRDVFMDSLEEEIKACVKAGR